MPGAWRSLDEWWQSPVRSSGNGAAQACAEHRAEQTGVVAMQRARHAAHSLIATANLRLAMVLHSGFYATRFLERRQRASLDMHQKMALFLNEVLTFLSLRRRPSISRRSRTVRFCADLARKRAVHMHKINGGRGHPYHPPGQPNLQAVGSRLSHLPRSTSRTRCAPGRSVKVLRMTISNARPIVSCVKAKCNRCTSNADPMRTPRSRVWCYGRWP